MNAIGVGTDLARRFAGRVWACVALAAASPLLAGCSTLDSLNPVLADSDAVELPGLAGSWGVGESTLVEIRRVADPHQPPGYLAVSSNEVDIDLGRNGGGWSRAIHDVERRSLDAGPGRFAPVKGRSPIAVPRDRPIWLDVRIGAVAGRLVADVVPSTVGDTALSRIVDDYGQIRLTHVAAVLELRQDTLLLFVISPDSAREALKRKQCTTPYITWPEMFSPPDVEFTGATDDVRSSYKCLIQIPGVVSDSAVRLHRMSPR